MVELTKQDWTTLVDAVRTLEHEHRDSMKDAKARAHDPNYEFRSQALQAANFHSEQLNKLSFLVVKVWRNAQEIK